MSGSGYGAESSWGYSSGSPYNGSYNGSFYQGGTAVPPIDTTAFWNQTAPPITTPTLTPNYFGNQAVASTPPAPQTEAVTVTAQPPPPVQVQTSSTSTPAPITTPTFTPNYFGNQVQAPESPPPAPAPQTEAVTVTAQRPTPVEVQTSPFSTPSGPITTPAFTPNYFGNQVQPNSPQAPKPQPSGGGSKGGGGSGGGPQPKPPQQQPQKPLQQTINFTQQPALTPAQLAALAAANRGQTTPAQQSALQQLTPAQLAALLKNPNLTAAQRAAVQQALASKLQQPTYAGGGGMTPAAAQKAAAAAASPFQASAAILPIILIGGVMAAYAATHPEFSKKVQVAYSSAKRRVRRAIL